MTRYTDEYHKQHEADVKAAEENQKGRDRQHVILPKQHLARLETERESRRTADNARLEQELMQTKLRLRWQWLIVHPGKIFSDFDSHAWSQPSWEPAGAVARQRNCGTETTSVRWLVLTPGV